MLVFVGGRKDSVGRTGEYSDVANLRGSKRHVKWVPSRRKSSFIYVALRGIARKNDVSLTPTVQPKRATGAL